MTAPADGTVTRVLVGVEEILRGLPALAGFGMNRHARNLATPDRSVLLTGWDVNPESVSGDVEIGVQVRLRGGPADAPDAMVDIEQDVIRPALTGLRGARLTNGVAVAFAWCEGAAGMGVDPPGRFEWAATYKIRTDRAGL